MMINSLASASTILAVLCAVESAVSRRVLRIEYSKNERLTAKATKSSPSMKRNEKELKQATVLKVPE